MCVLTQRLPSQQYLADAGDEAPVGLGCVVWHIVQWSESCWQGAGDEDMRLSWLRPFVCFCQVLDREESRVGVTCALEDSCWRQCVCSINVKFVWPLDVEETMLVCSQEMLAIILWTGRIERSPNALKERWFGPGTSVGDD